jgi:hypothetical protein
MKKFGTPIAAGPGRASENDGLAGVGTPPSVLAGAGLAGAGLAGAGAGAAGFGAPGFGGLGFVAFFGFGFGGGGGPCPGVFGLDVVVVGVLPFPPPFPPPFDCGVVELVVGAGVGAGALAAGGQDSCTFCTGPGRLSEDTGAPGGSEKVRTCPLTRVTVTVQLAAEALGSAAIADTARTVPADAMATFSFRRLNTVALFPPAMPSAATVRTPRRWQTRESSY